MPAGQHTTPTHEDLRVLIEKMSSDMDNGFRKIHDILGASSDDGLGGQGLIGKINRTDAEIKEINNLKNKGMGILAALTVTGVLLILGIKQWIGSIVNSLWSG